MCEGWEKLGPYYKLDQELGGWIQLTYYDDSTFLMRVLDRLFEYVDCPQPAMYFGLSNSV